MDKTTCDLGLVSNLNVNNSKKKSKSTDSTNNQKDIEVESDYFTVERILDTKLDRKGKRKYLVKWENYSDDKNSWEPAKHFKTCLWKIEEFENSLKPTSFLLPKASSNSVSMVRSNSAETSTDKGYETDDRSSDSSFEIDSAICDDIPLEFAILCSVPETKELEKIHRVAPIDGVLTFLVQWKENGFEGINGLPPLTSKNSNMVRAPAINAKFPQKVIQFYENTIYWRNITATKEEERLKVERAIKQAQERQAALNQTKPLETEGIDNDDFDPAEAAIEREKRKRDRFNVHESDLSSSDSDDCLVKSSSDEKEDADYKQDKKKKGKGQGKKKILNL